jgi:hypothetical protein
MLLVGSALLFFVGIYLERGIAAPSTPAAAAAPSVPPEASHAETAGDVGEAGHSEAPAASSEGAGETAATHAAEVRPFGIDLESPLLVGSAIAISLVLAFAVLRTTAPVVPLLIVGFALVFAFLDALEVSYQLGASRIGLAVVAAVLVALHVIAGIVALRLLMQPGGAVPATK